MTYNPIELKDTAEMMNSDDYKKRFQAEYIQVVIRNVQPTCPRAIYNFQIRAMADYIACLETRAVIEGIKLREIK